MIVFCHQHQTCATKKTASENDTHWAGFLKELVGILVEDIDSGELLMSVKTNATY